MATPLVGELAGREGEIALRRQPLLEREKVRRQRRLLTEAGAMGRPP